MVFAGACLLLTAGCTASLDPSMVGIGGSVSLPALKRSERQAVVYPTGADTKGKFDELTTLMALQGGICRLSIRNIGLIED